MGSEDLFKKRKALRASNLGRRTASKTSKESILIVCEGSKTEPFYLDSLIVFLNLKQRVVQEEIVVDRRMHGLDPSRLVKRAKDLFDKKISEGFTYDRVYCVFDKDCHTQYESACQKINKQPLKKKSSTMYAITSVPCFEVWLLFHFISSSAPFHASDSRSVCDQVIAKLKTANPSFANYEKANMDTFENTKSKLSDARNNAKIIFEQIVHNGDNPSTRMFQLVDDLEAMAKQEST